LFFIALNLNYPFLNNTQAIPGFLSQKFDNGLKIEIFYFNDFLLHWPLFTFCFAKNLKISDIEQLNNVFIKKVNALQIQETRFQPPIIND
jgi:hypothetical protein